MAKPQETEPEAAAPRLYLAIAADCPPAAFTATLEAADIACVLLLARQLDADALGAAVEVLGPLAQARDVVVVTPNLDLSACQAALEAATARA